MAALDVESVEARRQSAQTRRANQALVVAAAAMFVVSFVTTASNIAVPVLEKDFPDASLTTTSWVVSAFNVTQVTFMLLGGRLADRWGRRRIFVAGMAVFCLGAALSAVAPVIGLVIASRVVQAVGVAMVLPSSLAAVLPLFPQSRHASVVSLWAAMGVLGSAVAPTMAAGVLQIASWRWVFAAVIPFGLAALVAGRNRLDQGVLPTDPAPLDLLGAVAGTMAVGGAAVVVVQGRHWGWTSPAIAAVAVVAVVAGWGFVVRSLRHPEPLLDLGLLRVAPFRVVTAATGLVSVATSATWFMYPLFMTAVWGYSIFEVGLAISPGALAMIPVTVISGRLADRHGYRPLLVGGSTVALLAVVWLAWRLQPGASYAAAFLPGTCGIGLGMGLMMGPANSAALREISPTKLGAANAAFNTVRFLGSALGVAVAAAVIGASEGVARTAALERAFWVVAALMAGGPLLLALRYRPTRPTRPTPTTGPTGPAT